MKRTEKTFFREFLSKGGGGRLWKGKVLEPFLSIVFHGLLGTCSFFEIAFVCLCALKKTFQIYLSAAFHFMVTLVSILKGVIKYF